MKLVTAVAAVLFVSTTTSAQPLPRHLTGVNVSARYSSSVDRTTLTATLGFAARDGGPSATVEFRASYTGPLRSMHDAPSVVDIVVAQHPDGEQSPTMALAVDGRPRPLNARSIASQSIAATISFDEFVRLVNAESLVQEAFDSELVFSTMQLRMLRRIAIEWSQTSAAAAQQQGDLAGTWAGTWDGAGSGNFELTLDKIKEGAPVGRVAVTTDGGNYNADLKSIVIDKQKLTATYEFPLDTGSEVHIAATFEGKDARGTWSLRQKGQDAEVVAGTFALTKK